MTPPRKVVDCHRSSWIRCSGATSTYTLTVSLRVTMGEFGFTRPERTFTETWSGTVDTAGRVRIQAASFTREGAPATHTYSGEIKGSTLTLSGFRWSDRCSGTLTNYAAR